MLWEGWFWGVDPQLTHIGAAFIHGDTGEFHTCSAQWPKGRHFAAQLDITHDHAKAWGESMAQRFPPCAIGIEQPFGRTVPVKLLRNLGVLEAAWAELAPHRIWRPPGAWKSQIGLAGNASKEQIQEWAWGAGWQGSDEHQADALGVGRATMLELGSLIRMMPYKGEKP